MGIPAFGQSPQPGVPQVERQPPLLVEVDVEVDVLEVVVVEVEPAPPLAVRSATRPSMPSTVLHALRAMAAAASRAIGESKRKTV